MRMKRLLSLVISTAMMLSTFSGLVMTSASADEGDTPTAENHNIWTSSAADAEVEEGGLLAETDAASLYTIFKPGYYDVNDPFKEVPESTNEVIGDRTFTSYISTFDIKDETGAVITSGQNGGWDNDKGTLREGNYKGLLKIVPKADGVVTLYCLSVGSNKNVCILKDGTTNFKNPGVEGGSIVYTPGTGSMAVKAQLTANETYYMFVDGSKGRFAAVDYEVGAEYEQATPPPAPTVDPNAKSWTASADDIGRKAGDLLMGGLTLVSDNSSTNKAYISAADNGKIDTADDGKVFSGSALKFVAPSDGQLEVTMIDLGEATVNEETGEVTTTKSVTPVIYGVSEKGNVFEYTTSGNKERVVCKADVTEGNTYYITATGTKGRFSAAKFTPASEIPEETPTPSEEPVTNGISYKDGVVTVNLEDTSVTTGVLIVASYEGNALSDVKTETLTFTDGTATKEITVENGAKLMVWDSLEGMKPICPAYTVDSTGITPAPNTPTPTEDPDGLRDIIWIAADPAFDSIVAGNAGTAKGLTATAGFSSNDKTVKYTHNGTDEYTFTRQWKHGNSNQTLSFTPEQSCVVTVVFNGNGAVDREVTIKQGEELIARGLSTDTSTSAAEVVVGDILDPTAGDVVIGGGGSNKNISAIFVEYYDADPDKEITGVIDNQTGEDLSADTIVFTNVKDESDVVEVAYTANYAATLKKGETYNISVKGKEDSLCPTISTSSIAVTKNRNAQTHNITLVKIEDMTVTGTVSTISSNDMKTPVYPYNSEIGASVIFTKKGDSEPYATAAVGADGTYTTKLLSNEEYDVTISGTEDYTLSPLSISYELVGGSEEPYKNILLMKNTPDTVEYKETLTVGTNKDYPSVSEALAAVRKMTRTAGQTVTIVVDPGTYEEQIQIDRDNIVLKAADENNKPTIQWYYGIGYVYYSAADGGWYNADYAAAKIKQSTAEKWGAVLRTRNKGFRAENINFVNTFNKEIVAKEIADGVKPGGNDAHYGFDRTADKTPAQVKSKAATERAAAIFAEGSEIELYRCSFISSQDTFGTGAASMYVKECDIAGNTDYICGGNNCYFEDCNLIWYGYSDAPNGGYITATKTGAAPPAELGYYLKNCTVKYSGEDDMKFAAGSWGRNWGDKNCQTIFDGVTIASGTEVPGAWVKMSGAELPNSVLYVHDVNMADGTTVDVSSKTFNPNGTIAENNFTLPHATDFFGTMWTPVHYTGEIPAVSTYKSIWEFGNTAPQGGALLDKEYQGVTLDFASNTYLGSELAADKAVTMKIDATNGKVNPANATNGQFNAGTKLIIPVVDGSVLTVKGYNDLEFKINDTSYTAGSEPVKYTHSGAAGNVTVESTGGMCYMEYIILEWPKDSETPALKQTAYTTTWNFGHSNGAPDYNAEGAASQPISIAGENDAETTQTMVVDATSGKFNNIGRIDNLALVGDNTTFTFPVVEGTVITFDAYNADGTLTIGGTSFKKTESYTVPAGVTSVTATAAGVGYMSFIQTVTPVANGKPQDSATPPTTDPTTPPTEPPTPTQDPAPASKWTAKAATGYTATVDNDGADVLTAAANSTGSGFVYDLTQIEGFELPDSYATANGTLTVSFDMLVSYAAAPSDNYFVMLSTDNTNNRAWHGGSNKELGGFAGYANWNKVQILGSSASTGSTEADTVQNGTALVHDEYKTITYTIDFSAENKIFKATYDGTEYAPTTDLSNLENGKLYLNTTFDAGASDAVLKIKNITASYTAGGTVTPEPSDEDVTVSGTIGITGKYKNTGNKVDSYMLVPADLTLTFTEGETVKTATITGKETADGSGLAYTATLDPSKTYNIKLMDTNGNTYALDATSVATTTEATATQNLIATKKYAYPVTIQYDENSYNALMSDRTITDDTEFSIRFNPVSINGDSNNNFTPPALKFKRTDVDAETRTVTVTGYDLPALDTDGEHDAYTKAWFEDSKIPKAVILNTGADQIGLSSNGLPVIVFRNNPNFSVTLASAPTSVEINGTMEVNNTLTTVVVPADAAVTYQWYTAEAADAEESAWTAIDDATASSLTLTAAQEGKYIAVKVTGTGIAGTASAITESAVEGSNITSYTYTFALDQTASTAPTVNTNTNLLSSSDNNVDKAISMILVAKDNPSSCTAVSPKSYDNNTAYSKWRIATRGNGDFQKLSGAVDTSAADFSWGSYSNASGNPLIVVTPKVRGTFSITIGHRVSDNSTFYIWDNEKGEMQTDSGKAVIKTLTLTLEAGHTYVMGHVGTGDGAVFEASFTTLENLPE